MYKVQVEYRDWETMSIVKFRIGTEPYTVIPNTTLQDKNLSLEARGLLAFLLSKPGNWQIHKTQLQDELRLGRNRLDRIFDELATNGYAERIENREAGRYSSVDWVIHPSPLHRKPLTVEPTAVDGCTVISNYKGKTTKERGIQRKDNTNALFGQVWETYPRKTNRKGAEAAFIARLGEGITVEQLTEATQNYAQFRRGQDPNFTMLGATFYGPNERWRDYLSGSPELTAKRKEFSVLDLYADEPTRGN